MWIRRAAIRPVPPHARVPERAVAEVAGELSADDEEARRRLDGAFARFEEGQPALSRRIAAALARPIDETALALGYFLTLAVWLAFERAFDARLGSVDEVDLGVVDEALSVDEELRRVDPAESIDSDDVVAMEQPHVLSFVHEHLEAALEAHAGQVDVDDVSAIYRLVLVEVLALSYAVAPPEHLHLPKTTFSA